jgi:adhesin/invasin
VKTNCNKKSDAGFTLTELLVTIIILGVLSGIAVFSLTGVPGQAAVAACNADARSVQVALSAYYAQNNSYPATGTSVVNGAPGQATYSLNDYPLTGQGTSAGQFGPNNQPYMQTYPNNPGANYAILVGPNSTGALTGQVDVQVWTNGGTQVLEEPYATNNLCNVLGNLSPATLAAAGSLGNAANNIVTVSNSPYSDSTGSYLFRVNSNGTVTVTLTNSAGSPVSYQGVTLSQPASPSATLTLNGMSGSGSAVTSSTNSYGQATFTVKDTARETLTLPLTASQGGAASFSIGTVKVRFYGASVACTVDPTTCPSSSSVIVTKIPTVSTNTSTPNGAGQVTVTLSDSSGNPVPGDVVSLTATNGAIISPATATTGASGTAVFSVSYSATSDAQVSVTALDTTNGNLNLGTVALLYFYIPTVSNSSLVKSCQSPLYSDGNASCTVTATLKDSAGHAIGGAPVTLTGGTSTASGFTTVTTSSSGTASFTITDTKAETLTLQATDTYSGVTVPATGLTATFVIPAICVGSQGSTISASPTSLFVSATSTITVTIADGTGSCSNGSPLSGVSVSLSANHGSATGTSAQTTNANGVATFNVSDTIAEADTFTVFITSSTANSAITSTSGLISGFSTSVTFKGVPKYIATSQATAVACSTNIYKCGFSNSGYYTTITVTVTDSTSAAVAGVTVNLSGVSGASSNSNQSGTTSSNGTVTFILYNTTATTASNKPINYTVTVSGYPLVTTSSTASV